MYITATLTHTHAHTHTGVPGSPSRPIVSDPSSTSVTLRFVFADLGSGELQGVVTNITQTSNGAMHTRYFGVAAGQQAYQVRGLVGSRGERRRKIQVLLSLG